MDHAPPFTLYCNVDPVGQGVPVTALMIPPLTEQVASHALFVIVTFGGAVSNVGHEPVMAIGLQFDEANKQLPDAINALML